MNRQLTVALEIAAIVAALVFILWLGGVFTPPPPPTPTPTAFITSTPPPTPKPTLIPTPVGTLPPLTQATGVIAFTSTRDGNAEIYRMAADGSAQQNLTKNIAEDSLIGWSPDGQRLAFFSTRANGWLEIFVMDADGSNVLQLTHTFGSNMAYGIPVNWSPDGQYLLAVRQSPWQVEHYPYGNSLDFIHTDGSGAKPLYSTRSYGVPAAFSPDGHTIAVVMITESGSGLYSSPFSEKPNFQLVSRNCSNDFVWRPNQNRITCSSGSSFFDMDPDGSDQTSIWASTASQDYSYGMAWSPDNSKLLTDLIGYGNGGPSAQSLTLIDPDAKTLTPIYRDTSLDGFSWSPDSQWVTFTSRKDGQANIYIFNIYTAQSVSPAEPQQLTNEGDNYLAQWRPIMAP